MKNSYILLILITVNVGLFFIPNQSSYSQESSVVNASQTSNPSSMVSDWVKSIHSYVPAIVGSFIVGVIGSSAYFVALKLGYVNAEQIEEKFKTRGMPLTFAIIGGTVAVIFQLPQASTFTPIQSFVLGITWPFIVSQYVSRASTEGADVLKQLRST